MMRLFHRDVASATHARPARPWLCLVTVFLAMGVSAAPQQGDEKSADQLDSRTGSVFEQVTPVLQEAVELIDQHDDLPKRRFLFGDDQRSNREAINELLDEALKMLGVSGLTEQRDQIRELEAQIRAAHEKIATYQRKRVSAPVNESLSAVDKVNPFVKTREGYDKWIAAEQENIAAWQEDRQRIKADFAERLRSVGLELGDEEVEGLLSNVTGDDLVTMAVVFDHVRKITDQLESLTAQSGEAVETAKRYYGMYLVLVEVLDRIQMHFLHDIHENHIPALRQYIEQADENIEQAQKLIRKDGGDRKILESNIRANELTRKAAENYIDNLQRQAAMVEAENAEVKKTLATALNTYKTVKLSSDLATLMRAGRESFSTLMRLRLPYLREFNNETIRKEYQRMTEQLRSGT